VRTLVYACVPLAALLLIGEVVARVTGAGGLILYPTQTNCLRRSPLLGEEFRPHCTARVGGKEFRTNALGLRDGEVTDDGRIRILAIGDSCTFGWGVEQREAYPQVLQVLLDGGAGPGGYRVINAGVPGYTSHHGLAYLQERGPALRPAIVIAGYGFNDIVAHGDVRDALAWQRRMLPLLRLDDALIDSSRLWRWLRWMTLRPPPPDLPLRSSAAQYEATLRGIVAESRAQGAQPLLLSFFGAESPQRGHIAALDTVSRDLGVPLITYDGPRFDVVHPTPEGYARLSRQIAQRLYDTGAVPVRVD
jgi:lysophospholipase L1-like esterase